MAFGIHLERMQPPHDPDNDNRERFSPQIEAQLEEVLDLTKGVRQWIQNIRAREEKLRADFVKSERYLDASEVTKSLGELDKLAENCNVAEHNYEIIQSGRGEPPTEEELRKIYDGLNAVYEETQNYFAPRP